MPIWTAAVTNAIRRHVAMTGSPLFTRQALIAAELGAIEGETHTQGRTPTQTLGRELQQLRDDGVIEFLERGTYRWLGAMPEAEPTYPSKGMLVLPIDPDPDARPESSYRFPTRWLPTAHRLAHQWVIYQAGRSSLNGDYIAAARVERIETDPDRANGSVVQITPGSYLDFGRIVQFEDEGIALERGLLDPTGRLNGDRAARSVRAISDADFDRIVQRGLVAEEELLPRTDADEGAGITALLEERSPWEGPIDRATMLVSRTVRDGQFRKRVLDTYGGRCALTGIKLINGGGRVETEAAHIMSVAAGGPDKIDNGIALSGTIHWMFDRGLVSLSDAGDILLSREINDCDSVERLIHSDRKAVFPDKAAHRPHPHYLHWHRTECFHG